MVVDAARTYPDLTVTEYEVWRAPGGLAADAAVGQPSTASSRGGADHGHRRTGCGSGSPTHTGPRWSARSSLPRAAGRRRSRGRPSLGPPRRAQSSLENSSLAFSTAGDRLRRRSQPLFAVGDLHAVWRSSCAPAAAPRDRRRLRVPSVTAGMFALYMAGIYTALSVIGHLTIQSLSRHRRRVRDRQRQGLLRRQEGVVIHRSPSRRSRLYRRMRSAAGAARSAARSRDGRGQSASRSRNPVHAGSPCSGPGARRAGRHHGRSRRAVRALHGPVLPDEFFVFVLAVRTMRASGEEKHGGCSSSSRASPCSRLRGTVWCGPRRWTTRPGARPSSPGRSSSARCTHRGVIAAPAQDLPPSPVAPRPRRGRRLRLTRTGQPGGPAWAQASSQASKAADV